MDAHARLDCRYISQCVRALNEYEADNVGGNMVTLPQTPSFLGNAIVLSLSHRFGVGNSYFRAHPREPKWVDTVFGGCYRRSVFDSVGYFNEALVRGQDMEFNLRLKKAGGRTLLIPDIVSYYYARSTLWEFCKHNWNNGVWAIIPFLYSDIIPVSVRHLIPLGFAIGLMGSLILSLFWQLGLCLLGGLLGSYLLMGMLASIQIAFREHTPKYLFLMPWIFFCLHINYGIGSLWGCARVLVGSLLTSSTKPGGAQI
jgi:GT2 family glycosyltransferase